MTRPARNVRNLLLVLGDQLDPNSPLLDRCDPRSDVIWMAEVDEEATHVWSHKARIACFLAAMRHFRDGVRKRGVTVHYRELDDPDNRGSLGAELETAVRRLRPERILVVEPGEWRVEQRLKDLAGELAVPLEILPDAHFLAARADFEAHAAGRKQLRMEYFYREARSKTGVLIQRGRPVGGRWNFDTENRRAFGKEGPGDVSPPLSFPPDAVTRNVLRLVDKRFQKHPGSLKHFDWPVTPAQGREALEDFILHRLDRFGPFQDAMWTDEPFLFHSLLSVALNLKILNPRDAIAAAVESFRKGKVSIASTEGFVRQILGWREYVRGVYWNFMPRYAEMNALGATMPLPDFYWSGETDMNCLRQAIGQTLEYGYAHHIQRLMVTGLFALLFGVHPKEVHRWYLAIYADAVEWVELPNTLGMSQFADGGIMASKPYAASGNYIRRMSNYCRGCRYRPAEATGEGACPMTTLYWDFLSRHEQTLAANRRMQMQLRNLRRLGEADRKDINRQAERFRTRCLS